jgi:23S rRNA maturation mini-RNase III
MAEEAWESQGMSFLSEDRVTSRIRQQIELTTPDEDELRTFIEGDSTADIVRQVTDAFAEELSEIIKRARQEQSDLVRKPNVERKRP